MIFFIASWIFFTISSIGCSISDKVKYVDEYLIPFCIKLSTQDVLVYNKRIDSTLRGNIGTEINAMLDNLEDDRIAVVIPSYPDSGRIVVNKTMLVNGVLLENSDAGKTLKLL